MRVGRSGIDQSLLAAAIFSEPFAQGLKLGLSTSAALLFDEALDFEADLKNFGDSSKVVTLLV